MGEGWTPLVNAPTLADASASDASQPVPDIRLKNETTNPTWSWKDRVAALVVSHAVASGADRIATASSGNQGCAIAAYAARAGIDRVLVCASPSSEPPHCRQMRAHGAAVVTLSEYDGRRSLLEALADRGWFVAYDLPEWFGGQPYVYEGYRTIAFELVEQLGGVPDTVAVPVGSGAGIYGVWKGFRELTAAGIVDETPRLFSAESTERHPLACAYNANEETVGFDHGPEPISTSTMAPTADDRALDAVRESGGAAYVVDREAVEAAIRACGRDGVFLEPASGLAAAAVSRALADGAIDPDETIVTIGSGAGISWPETTAGAVGRAPTVEPSIEAVADAVSFSLD
nr:pyridoxal-phosphate dependent enzyme [Natranaeroarchaeum aerophilus]